MTYRVQWTELGQEFDDSGIPSP